MASTPGRIRPWRHVGAFAGIVVALYALVFLTGDHRPNPKLGIDLQGGTRVTLTARTETGGVPPREQLLQAQSIIEQARVQAGQPSQRRRTERLRKILQPGDADVVAPVGCERPQRERIAVRLQRHRQRRHRQALRVQH